MAQYLAVLRIDTGIEVLVRGGLSGISHHLIKHAVCRPDTVSRRHDFHISIRVRPNMWHNYTTYSSAKQHTLQHKFNNDSFHIYKVG